MARGMDVVDAWKAAKAGKPNRDLQKAHEKAVKAAAQQQAKYLARRRSLRNTFSVFSTIGIISAFMAFMSGGPGQDDVPGGFWPWAITAGVSLVVVFNTGLSWRELKAPDPVVVPPAPGSVLAANAIGASEAAQLSHRRQQLANLIPALERLHPDAARELFQADAEAASMLTPLVERLSILNRMSVEMSGTSPAEAATKSANELRDRLAAGCVAYDRLLAAAAELLAAPDIGRGVDEILTPALDAMTAYAHGLRRSAS